MLEGGVPPSGIRGVYIGAAAIADYERDNFHIIPDA